MGSRLRQYCESLTSASPAGWGSLTKATRPAALSGSDFVPRPDTRHAGPRSLSFPTLPAASRVAYTRALRQ